MASKEKFQIQTLSGLWAENPTLSGLWAPGKAYPYTAKPGSNTGLGPLAHRPPPWPVQAKETSGSSLHTKSAYDGCAYSSPVYGRGSVSQTMVRDHWCQNYLG